MFMQPRPLLPKRRRFTSKTHRLLSKTHRLFGGPTAISKKFYVRRVSAISFLRASARVREKFTHTNPRNKKDLCKILCRLRVQNLKSSINLTQI